MPTKPQTSHPPVRSAVVGSRLLRRRLAAITGSILLVFLFFVPFNSALYDVLLFPCPDPRTPDVTPVLNELRSCGVGIKPVAFPSRNGNVLHGIYFSLPNTSKVFLFSHGKGNNIYTQIPKMRQYLACGGSILMYDYQGFGNSQGRPSIENACDDAVAAYDYLIEAEHKKGRDIIGVGESFGTGVTGQLSQERELGAVILHSGYLSLAEAGRDRFFWLRCYPDFCFPPQLLNNVSVFKKRHPPLLIVHGKTDSVISCRHAEQLYEFSAEPKSLLLLSRGHCTYGEGNEFASAVRKHIEY